MLTLGDVGDLIDKPAANHLFDPEPPLEEIVKLPTLKDLNRDQATTNQSHIPTIQES